MKENIAEQDKKENKKLKYEGGMLQYFKRERAGLKEIALCEVLQKEKEQPLYTSGESAFSSKGLR